MYKYFSKKLFILNTSFNRYRALFEGKALLKGGIIHGNMVCTCMQMLQSKNTVYSYRGSSPNAHFGTRKNIVLVGEIALLEDFGTTLCKDTENAKLHAPKTKLCWIEFRVRQRVSVYFLFYFILYRLNKIGIF